MPTDSGYVAIDAGAYLSLALTGAAAQASIPVTVLVDPLAALNRLVDDVESLNLQNGILNSLDAKLANAVAALEDIKTNNDGAAVNKIQAFINEVEAQAGNKIPQEAADDLIAAAYRIINALTSQ